MTSTASPHAGVAADDKNIYDSDNGKHGEFQSSPADAQTPEYGVQKQDELTYQFDDSRKLGITSSVFVILNKMIGTGIFSTPSGIFAATGSVGVSLFLWVIGGILTFAGLSAFVEFGLAIPRSGGEKNYLERVYRHPRLLATCVLMSQMILLGFSSGNSLAFGRYCLFASGSSVADGWQARGVAIACITFAVTLHATLPKWGIRLFNVLGFFKVFILIFIVFSGFAALAGHRKVPNPHNFDNAFRLEEGPGYGGGGAYEYATAILRIVYSYKGWENVNYVLGEVKSPRKTLKIAAPLAIGGTTILYVLANVAYFSAISKEDLAASEVIVAGLFFRNVFGNSAGARALPAFVALSNLGNVLAVSFAHSRLNQEFAKEGLLPWSRFWASNKPFNAPATALFLHWLITVIILVAPPAGPAYNFITDLYTYPGAWINGFVALGLLWLRFGPERAKWSTENTQYRAWMPIIVLYLLANIFLAIVPFIPPTGANNPEGYPFYVFPVVGVGVLLGGAVYWLFWKRILPSVLGYRIETRHRISDVDGSETVTYVKVYTKEDKAH